ncbi:hypothetical protein PIB30_089998, partial [Stylosanthes scabra]|nr:hypothetical protein [Stylosanthes scabra]
SKTTSSMLPFSDFQRDVMTRCRVAVSQLHLNEWGFILVFEKVCLHYAFRPTIRLFFYIYDVHFPLVVTGISPSGRVRGGGYLIPIKSRFRNSSGTTSRSWPPPESKLFGWIMKINLFLRFIGILK